jgi:hypothetical protein
MLRSLEVDGRGQGWQLGPKTYAVPAVRRFDFNGSGNDTEIDEDPVFTGVRGNNLYNANNGYGWTQSVSEFQRATTGQGQRLAVPRRPLGLGGRTFQVAD